MGKYQVSQNVAFTITKPDDSSIFLSMTQEEAYELWMELGARLGSVSHIPKRSPEPTHLPTGTKMRDSEGDVLIRMEDGWRWYRINDEIRYDNDILRWEDVNHYSFDVMPNDG